MLDTLTSRNHQDFRQRYQGTFGWFQTPPPERKIFVQVTDVSSDQVTFTDSKNIPYIVYRDSGYVFEFLPVMKGWFNTKNNLMYLSRIPARQWHRGISSGNTTVEIFNEGRNIAVPCNMASLSQVFEQAISVEDAAKRHNFALSRYFAIAGDSLWFQNQRVGAVVEKQIVLWNKIIEQELKDTIKRLPDTINLKVA
jgi:hypothetical protein